MDILTVFQWMVLSFIAIFVPIFLMLLVFSCARLVRSCSLRGRKSVSTMKLVKTPYDITAFDGFMAQADVDRIISRRQERIAEKAARENVSVSENGCQLENIDYDVATVLAVDQLLDTSFLISDEELACFVPDVNLEIIGAKRDHV